MQHDLDQLTIMCLRVYVCDNREVVQKAEAASCYVNGTELLQSEPFHRTKEYLVALGYCITLSGSTKCCHK